MTERGVRGGGIRANVWAVGVALVLALIQGSLLNDIRLDKADTRDEATYLTLGARWWVSGYVPMNALPIVSYATVLGNLGLLEQLPPLDTNQAMGVDSNPFYPEQIRWARVPTLLITCLGGLALFAAGSYWGVGVGLFTQSLWVFSPNILAHGSLAALDGWAAALGCFVLWAWVHLWKFPGTSALVATGIMVGLAGACKIPTLGFCLVVALTLWWQHRQHPGVALRKGLVFVAVVSLTLWVGYGLSVGQVRAGTSFGRFDLGPLPAPSLFRSFLVQYDHGFHKGHANWVGDEVHYSGWWWYYLACIVLKGSLACFVLLGIRLWHLKYRRQVEDLLLLIFPLLLFGVFSLGKTQLGIRYLLPVFPCVLLWLALSLPQMVRRWGRGGLYVAGGVVGILGLETMAIHPHELMFFNQAVGGPERGGAFMTQGSDWCQDRKLVGEWARTHGVKQMYVVGCQKMSMRVWQIPLAPDPPRCARIPGVYALSLTELRRPLHQGTTCMAWLRQESPVAVLGHDFFIYEVK